MSMRKLSSDMPAEKAAMQLEYKRMELLYFDNLSSSQMIAFANDLIIATPWQSTTANEEVMIIKLHLGTDVFQNTNLSFPAILLRAGTTSSTSLHENQNSNNFSNEICSNQNESFVIDNWCTNHLTPVPFTPSNSRPLESAITSRNQNNISEIHLNSLHPSTTAKQKQKKKKRSKKKCCDCSADTIRPTNKHQKVGKNQVSTKSTKINNMSKETTKKTVAKNVQRFVRQKMLPPEVRAKRRRQANARETKRMHGIMNAFTRLRDHVPDMQHGRPLSKLETIKMAIEYIKCLDDLLLSNSPNATIDVAASKACGKVFADSAKRKMQRWLDGKLKSM